MSHFLYKSEVNSEDKVSAGDWSQHLWGTTLMELEALIKELDIYIQLHIKTALSCLFLSSYYFPLICVRANYRFFVPAHCYMLGEWSTENSPFQRFLVQKCQYPRR